MIVSKSRSLVKSLTWRLVAIISTFLSIYVVTGKFKFALQGTMLTNIINFILYYIHEREWNQIQWGRYDNN